MLATMVFPWQQHPLVPARCRDYLRVLINIPARGNIGGKYIMKKAKFASMLAVAGGLALATTACGNKAEEAAADATEAAEEATEAAADATEAAAEAGTEAACAAAEGACAAKEGACAAKEGACAAACAAKEGACAAK